MIFYKEHPLKENYDIALNRIFFKSKFKDAYTAKFLICPRGLTIGAYAQDGELKEFYVTVKRYGYDSLSNNGFEFSDLSDYETDHYSCEKLTPEMKLFCVEYIKEVDEELYETVKRLIKI